MASAGPPKGGGQAVPSVALAAAQVFGSRIVGQAAGVLAAVIAARLLGPVAFGQYSFALVAALIMAQLPGAGLDMAVVRASAGLRLGDPERARGVLLVAGVGKLALTACAALVALTLAASPVALGSDGASAARELEGRAAPLRVAAIAALALAATEFAVAALQAHERFDRILVASLASAVLRLLPLVGLGLAGSLTLGSALATVAGAAVTGAAVVTWLAWSTWRGPIALDRRALTSLFGAARWLVAATLLGVLTSNLDVLMLARVSGPEATGVYSSGRSLALPLAMLGSTLGTVLLPRLSRLPGGAMGGFVCTVSLQAGAAALVLGAAAIAGAPLAVRLVFGEPYAEAVPVLQLLAIAFLLQVVSWPAVAAVMALDRPEVIAAISAGMLVFVATGYALAMPVYGAVGTAWVYLAGCAGCLPLYALIVARLLRGSGASDERTQPEITSAGGVHG